MSFNLEKRGCVNKTKIICVATRNWCTIEWISSQFICVISWLEMIAMQQASQNVSNVMCNLKCWKRMMKYGNFIQIWGTWKSQADHDMSFYFHCPKLWQFIFSNFTTCAFGNVAFDIVRILLQPNDVRKTHYLKNLRATKKMAKRIFAICNATCCSMKCYAILYSAMAMSIFLHNKVINYTATDLAWFYCKCKNMSKFAWFSHVSNICYLNILNACY